MSIGQSCCLAAPRGFRGVFYFGQVMNREKRNDIISLVEPLLRQAGYECIEVEWDAHERALRIFIDGPSGVNMDDCLAANRALVNLEELDELIPGSYRLEVSSPGIERPLRELEHFRKAIGEQISVKLSQKVNNQRQGRGRLVAVTEGEELVLDREAGPWQFPISFVDSAKLVYDWSQV